MDVDEMGGIGQLNWYIWGNARLRWSWIEIAFFRSRSFSNGVCFLMPSDTFRNTPIDTRHIIDVRAELIAKPHMAHVSMTFTHFLKQ